MLDGGICVDWRGCLTGLAPYLACGEIFLMRPEAFDVTAHSETLLAVVLGAVLATLSGLIATQFESHLRRRERERDAALLFGELLSTLKILIDRSEDARARGEPYGAITIRMLRAVRRELDIYDRNREALYDLRRAELRLRIHGSMVRIALALDGIFDNHDAITAAGDQQAVPGMVTFHEGRDRSFDFLRENASDIDGILAALAKPAKQRFTIGT